MRCETDQGPPEGGAVGVGDEVGDGVGLAVGDGVLGAGSM
jgi:hypothetical protein